MMHVLLRLIDRVQSRMITVIKRVLLSSKFLTAHFPLVVGTNTSSYVAPQRKTLCRRSIKSKRSQASGFRALCASCMRSLSYTLNASKAVNESVATGDGSSLEMMQVSKPSDTRTWREVRPAVEFCCWAVVVLCPFLRWVNGPAVTSDQFVMQIAVTSLALIIAVLLRLLVRCG